MDASSWRRREEGKRREKKEGKRKLSTHISTHQEDFIILIYYFQITLYRQQFSRQIILIIVSQVRVKIAYGLFQTIF